MKEQPIWKMAFRSYGNMLLAGVLCFIVTVSVAVFDLPGIANDLLLLLLLLPIYISLVYTPIWNEGDRNRNMVQFGHLTYDRYKGLKIGILLMLPYLIENVLLTLCWVKVIPDFYWLYKTLNAHIWPILTWINPIGEEAVISVSGLHFFELLLCWLLAAYPLVISVIAYRLGYKGVLLTERLVYKNNSGKKRSK